MVHAAHTFRVGCNGFSDQFVIGPFCPGDALHFQRALCVLAVDAAVQGVGIVDH